MNAQTIDYDKLQRQVDAHPYPLVFATIGGAHLYGFPSADSDFDLRDVQRRREQSDGDERRLRSASLHRSQAIGDGATYGCGWTRLHHRNAQCVPSWRNHKHENPAQDYRTLHLRSHGV